MAIHIEGETESVAIFFHGNFDLNDQWKLITGLCYSEQEKPGSFSYNSYDDSIGVVPVTSIGSAPAAADVCTAAFGNAGCLGLTGSASFLGPRPTIKTILIAPLAALLACNISLAKTPWST